MHLEEIIGKEIAKLLINADKTAMTFITKDNEEFNYIAEGGCCSNSWFEHISGLCYLAKISSVEYVGCDVDNDECEYIFKLRSEKGICDIEMRNSNSTYGGWVSFVENYDWSYYEKPMKEVEDDF